MKRKWQHPETPDTGRQYWRSLGELDETPEFQSWLEREFPQGAAELAAPETDGGVSRRNFVRLMGAATALAGFGMTSCRRPRRFLVPFNEHVEWNVPGNPLFYSTVKPRIGGLGGDPLVVTTHEGRPTKVDGNRLHPAVSGGSDAFMQASVLDLYDPDRSNNYLAKGGKSSAADFTDQFLTDFQKGVGDGAAFLVGDSSSPTRNRLLKDLKKRYPSAEFYRHEAISHDGCAEAQEILFGKGVRQVPRFDRAEKILSLDCDFLGLDRIGEDPVKEFTQGRQVEDAKGKVAKKMNRLYVVEPAFTLTGGMGDHRLRLPASQILKVAALFASEIAKATGDAALKTAVAATAGRVNAAVFNQKWIIEAAKDLAASKGKALVVAGSRHDKEVHLLVAAINTALGAYKGAKASLQTVNTGQKEARLPGIADLAKKMKADMVRTLMVIGESDPIFDAPADLNFAELMAKVPVSVHLGVRKNLTAKAATWHVPGAHYLESWGDLQSATGIYSAMQPMLLPLYNGLSEIEFFIKLLAEPEKAPAEGDKEAEVAHVAAIEDQPLPGLAEVKKTFATLAKGDVKKAWNATLRDGYLDKSKFTEAKAKVDLAKVTSGIDGVKLVDMPYAESIEVVLTTSAAVYDGRFANNGWMQEVPDPITKLTWDNAALLSQATFDKLGLKEDGELMEVTVGEAVIKVPALRAPGQADFTITLALGYYGHDAKGQEVEIGRVGSGVGFNAYPLKTTAASYVVRGAKVVGTGKKHILALTAEHYSMEGRALAREVTLDNYEEDPSAVQKHGMDAHIPENISLYKGPDLMNADNPVNDTERSNPWNFPFRVDPDHQWAMTVDMHSCLGCNACTVACQAENNIPIVGKAEVLNGREMHWIRMDRYFTTLKQEDLASQFRKGDGDRPGRRTVDDDSVEMIPQLIGCAQCEAAPCESVCPVNATVHTSDGLNAMTYNRCIGTRYCANNCPYKARRFNYFDFNKRAIDQLRLGPLAPAEGNATTTQQLQKNPNVTVRMRGVIEKCTYCVQRITTAKVAAKAKARESSDVQVPTNKVQTACQVACSADAIIFGNLKDPQDDVNQKNAKASPRNYELLKYLGIRARTTYLGRVRNPNPSMPGAAKVGKATSEML
ncbi:MAG: TAT-variant-translocated molybdopterin oxidoreductase [Verrucomicrobiales bacterium]|nr:TAT-variant-translocated molybdopterin oxidoreductase [Verrucomicrobiales bacterium]